MTPLAHHVQVGGRQTITYTSRTNYLWGHVNSTRIQFIIPYTLVMGVSSYLDDRLLDRHLEIINAIRSRINGLD